MFVKVHPCSAPSGSQFTVLLPGNVQRQTPRDWNTTELVLPSGINKAMGQNIVPPMNIPIPTKIDSNGWCTYPKMGYQNGFDNHSHKSFPAKDSMSCWPPVCQFRRACSSLLRSTGGVVLLSFSSLRETSVDEIHFAPL